MSRVSLLLLLLAGCHLATADIAEQESLDMASAAASRVEVVVVQPSEASIELALPGEVIGSRDVVLAASAGGRVESLSVKRGQEVTKGQGIARVDAEIAAAQLDQARAQQEQAAAELQRQTALGDLAPASAEHTARMQSQIADASVRAAEAHYSRAALRAPFAGTVADLYVEVGSHAAPGQPVARIVKLDPIRITLAVSDRDVVSLEPGMPVEVLTQARSGVLSGSISHVGPAADLNTRAFPVEVSVPNPGRGLLPGMIAQVRVHRAVATDAVVVPQEWIVTKRTEQGVFVEVDGVARWRSVVLGEVAGNQVVIRQGVKVEDRVVVTGHRTLTDGEPLLVVRSGVCCTGGRPTWGE
jgi:RND family efflux transporter MFP subunit